MKKLIYIYIVLFSVSVSAQIKDTLPNFNDKYFQLEEVDSIMVHLNEVSVLPKHKFKDKEDFRYYYWFKRKVYKAYPYAKLASERLDTLNARLSRIKSNSKRRKYTKRIQKYVEGEFTDQIKKMTRTEGRILIKLIHRQTGNTAFNNIKELRSGWRAFWYNTTANLFSLSLKEEYHPESNNEDYLIEDVLQRAFINDKLVIQPTKLNFNSEEILQNKNGSINVDVYKKMFAKMKKRGKVRKRKAMPKKE